MLGEESAYPMDWFVIAERDLRWVSRALDEDDPGIAGFFLQQALEKSLKAFLLHHGWSLRRIHDLKALLDEAVQYAPDLEGYRSLCERVTTYYLIERYPYAMHVGLTQVEIANGLRSARELVAKVGEVIAG
jgi:HEPN domain-containing protein